MVDSWGLASEFRKILPVGGGILSVCHTRGERGGTHRRGIPRLLGLQVCFGKMLRSGNGFSGCGALFTGQKCTSTSADVFLN